MFVKKKTAKTSMTKSRKHNIKNNQLKGILKRTVDENRNHAYYNALNYDKLSSGNTSEHSRTSDFLDVNNVLNNYDDNAMDNFKRSTDSEKSKFTKKIPTTIIQNEYNNNYDVAGNDVVRSDSTTDYLNDSENTEQPKSLSTLSNSELRDKKTNKSKSLDLRLFTFLKTINIMLNKPGGVNDIFRAMTLPSFLNKSIVFEVENPFKNLVNDEEFMVSFLKRLKYNINRSRY